MIASTSSDRQTLVLLLCSAWLAVRDAGAFLLQPQPLVVTGSRSRMLREFRRQHLTVVPPLSTTAVPVGDVAQTTKEEEESEQDQFNWFKSWYPLVPVEILDPEKPHHFKLLGMDVVVWKDAKIKDADSFGPKPKRQGRIERTGGEWRVFKDECPHRKVPLSEGRIENDGSLLCSYHAWRFDGDGNLVDAPQLDGDSPAMDGLKRRAGCSGFPARVVDGILWVWGETGDDARIESALNPPHKYGIPDDLPQDRLWKGPWNFRELPYGADYFIENVVDPAHVQVR